MSDKSIPAVRPLEPQKKAIVIGASSGIGAALVRELVHRGYVVAAVARRESLLDGMCVAINAARGQKVALPYVHDVTEYAQTPAVFQQVVRDLGGLDVIIYCAGVQPAVALDEYDFAKDLQMVEVNLLGAMAWLNQAAVRFSREGRGHIVAVSSVAGDRGRVGAPGYNTSKAALSTYLEALRNRLAPHGASVTTIKPGFVDTVLLENAPKTFWVIKPEKAAQVIAKAIERGKQTAYVPGRWALVMLIIRNIPSVIFRRLGV